MIPQFVTNNKFFFPKFIGKAYEPFETLTNNYFSELLNNGKVTIPFEWHLVIEDNLFFNSIKYDITGIDDDMLACELVFYCPTYNIYIKYEVNIPMFDTTLARSNNGEIEIFLVEPVEVVTIEYKECKNDSAIC